MSYSANTVSFGTTGLKTFNIGSAVQGYRISLCGIPGGIEQFEHRSVGVCTSTVQNCQTTLQDASQGISKSYTDRVVHLYTLVSGVITDAVVANHSSFSATGFTVNVTVTSASWQWLVEIWT